MYTKCYDNYFTRYYLKLRRCFIIYETQCVSLKYFCAPICTKELFCGRGYALCNTCMRCCPFRHRSCSGGFCQKVLARLIQSRRSNSLQFSRNPNRFLVVLSEGGQKGEKSLHVQSLSTDTRSRTYTLTDVNKGADKSE